MDPEGIDKRANPQIVDFTIGIRNLREIRIYPLSIYDQQQMGEIIAQTWEKFLQMEFEGKDITNVDAVKMILEVIGNNIVKILNIITGGEQKGEEIIKEMTNEQASDLAIHIFETNYAGTIKKVKDLLEKIGIVKSQSGRSSLSSADGTEDTL